MPGRDSPQINQLTSRHGTPLSSQRAGLPPQLRQRIRALGPTPRTSMEVLVDLGLSDVDIARYFGVPQTCIVSLRKIWGIRPQS